MISLTFAGAGGGKTTSMVKRVCSKLETLHPNRYACVITYTNESANDIRRKLSKEISAPQNLFVGTIHSFLYKFVFKLHYKEGSQFSVVSGLKNKEDALDDWVVPWAEKKFPDKNERMRVIDGLWKKKKNQIYKKLLEHKVITYDQLVKISYDLIKKAPVRNAVACNIQYLFIDEYQDTYKWLHEIFLYIYKANKTEIFAIGDPGQTVFTFTYATSENGAKRPSSWEEFPIQQLKKVSSYSENIENYRSSFQIVNFANTFKNAIRQKPVEPEFCPVMVIERGGFLDNYSIFNELRKIHNLTGSIFYLAKNNKSLGPYLMKVGNEDDSEWDIKSIEHIVTDHIGCSVSQFCQTNDITRLQFRSLAVSIAKENEITLDKVKKHFHALFDKLPLCCEQEIFPSSKKIICSNIEERALTMHKSKGLEAESVLVVFESNNHINKVLTKQNLMTSPTDEDLRLAYVACTRAKKLLVLACAEKINQSNITLLQSFKVKPAQI
jgi:DNA helicase-2/ATP-dependent DNA helicase PcrA